MTWGLPPSSIIPGGIRPTDFVHVDTNDGTCSRCRKTPPEDDVPVMLWSPDGVRLLIYCEACTGDEAWAAMATMTTLE